MTPRLLKFDADRAVIAAQHIRPDEGTFESRAQHGADEEVVNAPANVPGTRAGHLAPPGVMSPALFEFAEGVEETGAHEGAETGAFLGCEAVVVDVGLRVREVNFRVRHVEVAAEDHGFFLFQLFEVTKKIPIPLLADADVSKPRPRGAGPVA